MARPASDRPLRSTPVALLYIGMPAYIVVVGFAMRDLLESHSAPVAAVGVAAMAVFTALFFRLSFVYRPPGSPENGLGQIAAMCVLTIGLVLLGVTTAVFAAAVAAMAGESLAPRRSVPIILGGSALAVASAIANDFESPEILTQGIIVLVVGLFTFGVRRLTEANKELLAAREEVARLAVLDERVRFARDLHDLLGHSLTVIRAKSELASRLAPVDVAKAVQEMNEVEVVAREALAEVRETVTGYRHPSLATELTNARSALDVARISADVYADFVDLPEAVDETLAWVLREMVTNVVRHSAATTCRIEVTGADRTYSLTVADDGQGSKGSVGNGLAGARERLALVGGTLLIDSERGHQKGFHAVARIPRQS